MNKKNPIITFARIIIQDVRTELLILAEANNANKVLDCEISENGECIKQFRIFGGSATIELSELLDYHAEYSIIASQPDGLESDPILLVVTAPTVTSVNAVQDQLNICYEVEPQPRLQPSGLMVYIYDQEKSIPIVSQRVFDQSRKLAIETKGALGKDKSYNVELCLLFGSEQAYSQGSSSMRYQFFTGHGEPIEDDSSGLDVALQILLDTPVSTD